MYKSVIIVGTVIIVISFTLSLCVSKNRKDYMKWFFLCPLISITVSTNSILSIFYNFYGILPRYYIQSILFLLDLTFWFIFFLKVIRAKIFFNKLKFIYVFTMFFSLLILYANTYRNNNLHLIGLCNIGKTVFCVIYYQSIFRNLVYENLLKEPSFWIVTGLIFYTSLSLPFYGLHGYISDSFPDQIAGNIFSISNILIIIMHLFFMKSYLCTTRQSKE